VETNKCSRCSAANGTRSLNTIAHKWSEYKVKTKATAKKAGVEERTCSVCKAVNTREIPMLTVKPGTKEIPKDKIFAKPEKVTLTAPKGTTLYYTTDGKTTPTTKTKTKVSGGTTKTITISKKTSVWVVAKASGKSVSGVTKRVYKVKTATPTNKEAPKSATVKNGQKIVLTAPKNTTLYYTVDGKTTPTTKTKTKVAPGKTKSITIKNNTKLQVVAVKSGQEPSKVAVRNYKVKTAAPTNKEAPKSATVKKGQKIVLAAPKNTTLYYTVDGKTTPTTKTKTKVAPGKTKSITIKNNTKLQVIAVKSGQEPSKVAVRNYKVK
ncbi:MAG: chitobiase/beta-hexosaminidase C-terminal domain-containing protein, partial [Oscillospiraceae bacterium]|nr:chitobiase/beta-hexosaminidase C-terminal domain-containing protein [Oscillospiraceae bacterium]